MNIQEAYNLVKGTKLLTKNGIVFIFEDIESRQDGVWIHGRGFSHTCTIEIEPHNCEVYNFDTTHTVTEEEKKQRFLQFIDEREATSNNPIAKSMYKMIKSNFLTIYND